jgi:PAS domain S-box-containing protein
MKTREASHTADTISAYFLNSGQFAYLLTDPCGIIFLANNSLCEKLNLSLTNLTGKSIADFVPAGEKENCEKMIRETAALPGNVNAWDLHLASAGEPVLFRWEITALTNKKGLVENLQWVGVASGTINQTVPAIHGQDDLPERYKAYELCGNAIWCMDLKIPVSVSSSEDDLLAHCRQHAVLSECNDNMARMYGYDKAGEMIGATIEELMDLEDPARVNYLKSFFRDGFRTTDMETKEFNRYGTTKYFLNNMVGVVENGLLKRIWGTQQDITENKLKAEQLQKSELFYRNLIADSLDGMILTDEKGDISFVSDSIRQILGYEAGELTGRNAFEFVYPEDMTKAHTAFDDEIRLEAQFNFINIRLLKKSGEWIWCIVRGHNLFHNPYVGRMVIYFYDDSLRRFAEEAFHESEKLFHNLIQNLNLGVMVLNGKAEIMSCNPAMLKTIEYTEAQLLGKGIFTFPWIVLREDGSNFLLQDRPVYQVMKTRQPVHDVVMGIQSFKSHEWVWLMTNVDPVLDHQGNISTIICSYTDITEQRNRVKDQMLQELQKQRMLTQATIDGQEKERLQIGKELHDNISQHLTMTRLYLEVVTEKANGEVLEMITHAHKNLSDIINEIRILSQSLVPPTLGDLGLIESVQDLCDSLRRTQAFQVDFHHRYFTEEEIPDNMKLMLFRIIQEQVNNIVRHASAKQVIVKLQADAEQIILSISDDGVGFNAENHKRGLGLIGIVNRAGLFNAKTSIDTTPGKGCAITIIVPFSRTNGDLHHGD